MEDRSDCLTLALQGEALCRSGDFHSGVDRFTRALDLGTSDLSVLSAIYVQLGNAYFYLENYDKALEFHSHDIKIARMLEDEKGEAKASGNIATTLKCLGQYDEAVACCQRQLDIHRKLNDDKMAISRSLYNLGNIHLAKAKACISSSGDSSEPPDSAKEDLRCASEYYSENYALVKELNDLAAQGRVCGNLGSVQYMLGNFPQAVMYHQERLLLARECKDVPAERRAYTNLGNCHIFLGQYAIAEQYYLKALALVDPSRDHALQAQTCYSLGNTYSLMGEHARAVQYYERHLSIAKELHDAVGQGRACWSLGSAHAALGQTEEAIKYAEEHLRISQELGDPVGTSFAENNLQEYACHRDGACGSPEDIAARIRRISMEQMDLLRMTPDAKATKKALHPVPEDRQPSPAEPSPCSSGTTTNHVALPPNKPSVDDEEDFFDMLSRVQSHRLDDQRCSFVDNKENHHRFGNGSAKTGASHAAVRTFEDLMDMIAGVQSKRLDEQRADLPSPSVASPQVGNNRGAADRKSDSGEGDSLSDDQFFDMLMKVQGSRMGDQRATLSTTNVHKSSLTIPEEDFSTLVHLRRVSGSSSGATQKSTAEDASSKSSKGKKL